MSEGEGVFVFWSSEEARHITVSQALMASSFFFFFPQNLGRFVSFLQYVVKLRNTVDAMFYSSSLSMLASVPVTIWSKDMTMWEKYQ